MKSRLTFIVVGLGVVTGCSAKPDGMSDAELAAIRHSVDSVTQAFAQAERDLDPELVVSFIAPDFYMYVDGNRVGYASVVEQIRQTFGSLRRFETEFSNIEVIPLGPNGAIASFTFRDIIADTAGNLMTGRGPTTLGWQRRDGRWQIVYGDADHYPDTNPDQ